MFFISGMLKYQSVPQIRELWGKKLYGEQGTIRE